MQKKIQTEKSVFELLLITSFSFFYFIPGGCCGSQRKRTIVGGWAWAWWLVTDVQRLSLEVMTLNPMCEGVETAQGVPLTVTGVAQCKIMKVYYLKKQLNGFWNGFFFLLYFYSFITCFWFPIIFFFYTESGKL